MSLSGKPSESITQSDLLALVENEVRELKRIEYKQSLPGNMDSDKKEFLADVSSFANAAGGDLIYGMKAEDGMPTEVCGLGGINVDQEALRLESMIRSGIEPRIHGISTWAIESKELGVSFIIRIPRSWYPPHRVVYRGHDKFYTRSTNGKYPMDVSELRAAFTLSETTMDRIRDFREGRLVRIVAGETPVPLYDAPKIVLHLVPLRAFDPGAKFDVASLAHKKTELAPIGSLSWSDRHNFDGFLTYDQGNRSVGISYLQVFRNGTIEAVDAWILRDRPKVGRLIPAQFFESKLVEAVGRFLRRQKQLGVEPPVFVMLSLLRVSGYVMATGSRYPNLHDLTDFHPIDRNDLLVSEVMVDNLDSDPPQVMKPIFDAIWNAAGYPGSIYYDSEEKWKLKGK